MNHDQQVNAWLARQAGALPRLADLSFDGRRAFLAAHEPLLWVTWTQLFELALVSREAWIDVASARARDRDERKAAEWLVERLLKALRERPSLRYAPAWTNIRSWYAWWRGSGHSSRVVEVPLEGSTREGEDATAPAPPVDGDGFGEASRVDQLDSEKHMHELLDLVNTWAGLLARAVRSTGLVSLEVDWLWATCVERRPLSECLEGTSVEQRFLEVNKRVLTRQASIPGGTSPERLKRSRRGVAACFRFNLEALVSESHPGLVEAHRIFLGPVSDPDESPARPALPVTAVGLAQFRLAHTEMARRSEVALREDLVKTLWARVFKAALNGEVVRLLPTGAREPFRSEWTERVGPREEERE